MDVEYSAESVGMRGGGTVKYPETTTSKQIHIALKKEFDLTLGKKALFHKQQFTVYCNTFIPSSPENTDSKRLIKAIEDYAKKVGIKIDIPKVLRRAQKGVKAKVKKDTAQHKADVAYKDFKDEKEQLIKEHNKEQETKFIFNPDHLNTKVNFTLAHFGAEIGVGMLLPRNQDILDRKGNWIGEKQVYAPAMIYSGGGNRLDAVSSRYENDKKVTFNSIPIEDTKLPIRWSLPKIEQYIQHKDEPVNKGQILEKVTEQYKKLFYCSNELWHTIHALWDIGTYFMLLFKAYPIMELRGVKGSAKTKLMHISSMMSFNSSGIQIQPTASTFFRDAHELRPTKYIDEAEKLFMSYQKGVETDNIVNLINASYYYKGAVPRTEKVRDRWITKWYYVYSPTMIGSINGLKGATEDRAIIHVTTKPPANDKRGDLEVDEDLKVWSEIRDELYLFLLQDWEFVLDIYNSYQNDTKLRDRDFQIWKPLLVMSNILNPSVTNSIKRHAEKMSNIHAFTSIGEDTLQHNILKTMYELLKEGEGRILIKDIKARVEWDDKLSSKYIGSVIDKLGFLEQHKHTWRGNGYDMGMKLFETVVKPICPSIFASDASDSSGYRGKDKILPEEYLKNNDKSEEYKKLKSEKPEASEESEESEANTEMDYYIDGDGLECLKLGNVSHHKCVICGSNPCHFENSKGQPLCKDCVQKL